jgi:Domain of unknown function (DUF4126)
MANRHAALLVLAGLLAVEVVADKIPAVDSVNDVLQTVVRPTSGGMVFSAGSVSTTVAVDDPDAFLRVTSVQPFTLAVAASSRSPTRSSLGACSRERSISSSVTA